MISVNPNESTAISFDLNIEGNVKNVNSVSIVVESTKGFQIRVPATFNSDKVECELPPMESILESGEHPMSLEIVVDGKLYVPLQETILVEAPLQIEAKVAESQEVVVEEAPPVFKASLTSAILGKNKGKSK